MSAPGGYTPPEFPAGVPPEPEPGQPRHGVPVGAALGILAGVLVFGLVLVFTVGRPAPGPSSLVAQPGVSTSVQAGGSSSASARPSGGATTPQSTTTAGATGAATGTAAGDGGNPAEFQVGECVDTSGSGGSFNVDQAACAGAAYRIIHSFPDATGSVTADQSQCYSIDGNDSEFENGDPEDGYTLYCLNSLTGDYSPRRAAVNNCLDAKGDYEVDCSGSRAAWIVIGRIDGTTNTKDCAKYGSYDYSYYYTAAPQFVLCVNTYKH